MVSEGLADLFAYQAFPRTPPAPWDRALTEAQEHRYWQRARPLLDQPDTHHDDWFFGSGTVPRWDGYTLGYDLVGRYLKRQRLSPSAAVDVPAARILAAATL